MSVLYDKVFPLLYTSPKTLAKICGSALIVAALLLPCAIYFDAGLSRRVIRGDVKPGGRRTKTILYWTKIFDNESFYLGEGRKIFRGCRVYDCLATHDRGYQSPQEFDALLFHGRQTDPADLPTARSQAQKYVFLDLESPASPGLGDAYLPDRFYNWSMTYDRDSDVPRTYGNIVYSATNEIVYPLGTGGNDGFPIDAIRGDFDSGGNYTEGLEGKSRTVAWFVSHCRTSGLRERYVAELQKYVDVDIYGKCGNPRYCRSGNGKCYEMLEARYYFYLSFENSLCEDYVTEKFYNVMNYNVVPIVYGAANYSEFAPPGSFINIADFSGPKELAKHLRNLVANPRKYAEFFWWKNHFHVDLTHRQTLCKICEILHDNEKLIPSSIFRIDEFWSSEKCLDPEKFFRNFTRQ